MYYLKIALVLFFSVSAHANKCGPIDGAVQNILNRYMSGAARFNPRPDASFAQKAFANDFNAGNFSGERAGVSFTFGNTRIPVKVLERNAQGHLRVQYMQDGRVVEMTITDPKVIATGGRSSDAENLRIIDQQLKVQKGFNQNMTASMTGNPRQDFINDFRTNNFRGGGQAVTINVNGVAQNVYALEKTENGLRVLRQDAYGNVYLDEITDANAIAGAVRSSDTTTANNIAKQWKNQGQKNPSSSQQANAGGANRSGTSQRQQDFFNDYQNNNFSGERANVSFDFGGERLATQVLERTREGLRVRMFNSDGQVVERLITDPKILRTGGRSSSDIGAKAIEEQLRRQEQARARGQAGQETPEQFERRRREAEKRAQQEEALRQARQKAKEEAAREQARRQRAAEEERRRIEEELAAKNRANQQQRANPESQRRRNQQNESYNQGQYKYAKPMTDRELLLSEELLDSETQNMLQELIIVSNRSGLNKKHPKMKQTLRRLGNRLHPDKQDNATPAEKEKWKELFQYYQGILQNIPRK